MEVASASKFLDEELQLGKKDMKARLLFYFVLFSFFPIFRGTNTLMKQVERII